MFQNAESRHLNPVLLVKKTGRTEHTWK